MMKYCRIAFVFAALFAATAAGDEAVDTNVYDYFVEEAEALEPKLPWDASTPAEHAAWREKFEPKLDELLGRKPEHVPLEVKWDEDEKMETDTFTRHKIYVRSEEHYWIPAYYYVPKNLKEKAPAVICFHGHSGILPYIGEGTEAQREKGASHKLTYAQRFAEHGYISLAAVQRGWNETAAPGDRPHSCHRIAMSGFLIGRTAVGLRVWDGSRLLDFLETREEVDKDRIGAAGLSGGGTTTLFFTAMEPRVKTALVAGYFCTFRDSIYTIHHCICNCVPNIMQWGEMSDVGALIAPRPMLVISGTEDSIFPIDATKAAYEQLGETYRVLDAQDKIDSDFFEGPHMWSNNKDVAFLDEHLRGASQE